MLGVYYEICFVEAMIVDHNYFIVFASACCCQLILDSRASFNLVVFHEFNHEPIRSYEERARWNDTSISSGEHAREYGCRDIDGSQPDFWRDMAEVPDLGKPADVTGYH